MGFLTGRSDENAVADVDASELDAPSSPGEAVALADELEAMQSAAELANGERPSWLPERYSSPEDLAQAYRHAEQKISAQSEEIAQLRAGYADVAHRLEVFDVAAEQELAFDPRVQEELQRRDAQAILGVAEAADQATIAQLEQAGLVDPGQVQQVEAQQKTLVEAEAALATQFPTWTADRESVWQTVLTTPTLSAEVNAAQTPSDVVRTLANTYATLRAQQTIHPPVDTRVMKMQAQSAVGAGGRALTSDDDADAWAAIAAAGKTEYWKGAA